MNKTITQYPISLDSFCGQQTIIRNIKNMINATPEDSMPPHMLFLGESGGGKTTLAKAIYAELFSRNINFISIPTGRNITPQLLQVLLAKTGSKKALFFIDEIHELPSGVQEQLYEPMDSNMITYFSKAVTKMRLPPFTIIAATTEPGKLLKPLMSRFHHFHFSPYRIEDIQKMLKDIWINEAPIPQDVIENVAQRAKLNPRCMWNLITKIANSPTELTNEGVNQIFREWGIDKYGLNELDWRYLQVLYENLDPQGIANIAGMMNSDPKYIESEVEPYLIKMNWVIRSRSGRRLTPQGIAMVAERSA